MNTQRLASLVCLPLLLAMFPGCAPVRPLVSPLRPRTPLLVSRALRVGILDFGRAGSPEGQHARVTATVSAASQLFTALAKRTTDMPRFTLFDHGNLRSGGPLTEGNAGRPPFELDVLLTGTLLSPTDQQAGACYDVRLINAVSNELIRSYGRYCPDQAKGGTSAENLADGIAKLEQGSQATVTSVQGRMVIIDKGRKSNVLRGTVARLVAGGDTMLSLHKVQGRATEAAERLRETAPRRKEMRERVMRYSGAAQEPTLERMTIELQGHEERLIEEVVGEIYIAAVEENHSVGVLFRGEYALRGDLVFFK